MTRRRSPPQRTPEFRRIHAIPRRPAEYDPAELEQIVETMTELLRRDGGTMRLRPIQAVALLEMSIQKGAYLPIRVGGGKTLTSLLAATVLNAKRPLLIVPAKLQEKTRRAWQALSRHWRIWPGILIRSYEWLTREENANFLLEWKPDLIVLDESHKAKDRRRSRARRLQRYRDAFPECDFVAMTGTGSKRSILDYAHVLSWCIRGPTYPLPTTRDELESWSRVLDAGQDGDPGALSIFCDRGESVREGFRRRLAETFGIVTTRESEVEIPIVASILRPEVPREINEELAKMRVTWERPDGSAFKLATTMWRHARELALGFWYTWDPWPPPEWYLPRQAWGRACREILTRSRRPLDTELQVVRAIDAGHYPEYVETLQQWRAVRDTFEPTTKPVWISDYFLDVVARDAAHAKPTIYWVEHKAFGYALAKRINAPYYHRDAKTDERRSILDHPHDSHMIASAASIGEGFDLEYMHRMFFCFAPTSGLWIEQAVARAHRPGCLADEIDLTIVQACDEHVTATETMLSDAHYLQETQGQQKILMADWT